MASLKTNIFRKKLAQAVANGQPIHKITKMAFGTGGTTSTGSPKNYTGSETTLFNKVIEKNITPVFVNDILVSYKAELSASVDVSLIGQSINESSLIDENGDTIAMKTFTNKGIEEGVVIEFEFEIDF